MCCHDLTKVYYCIFVWHLFIVYLLNSLIERTTAAAVLCNIYLKPMYLVLTTLYIFSFLSFFSWLSKSCIWCRFLHNSFSISFLELFKVSLRAIVPVRIYLRQPSYSTQCIYVASDLEMLFSCLNLRVREGGVQEHSHWLRNRGSSKEFRRQNELPQKVRFGERFQTVRNDVMCLFGITSYQFILRFHLKHIGALRPFLFLHRIAIITMMKRKTILRSGAVKWVQLTAWGGLCPLPQGRPEERKTPAPCCSSAQGDPSRARNHRQIHSQKNHTLRFLQPEPDGQKTHTQGKTSA